jgi:hypothetical protein
MMGGSTARLAAASWGFGFLFRDVEDTASNVEENSETKEQLIEPMSSSRNPVVNFEQIVQVPSLQPHSSIIFLIAATIFAHYRRRANWNQAFECLGLTFGFVRKLHDRDFFIHHDFFRDVVDGFGEWGKARMSLREMALVKRQEFEASCLIPQDEKDKLECLAQFGQSHRPIGLHD